VAQSRASIATSTETSTTISDGRASAIQAAMRAVRARSPSWSMGA